MVAIGWGYYHPGNGQGENNSLERLMITRLVIAMMVRPTITNLEKTMIMTLVSVACSHVQYHV